MFCCSLHAFITSGRSKYRSFAISFRPMLLEDPAWASFEFVVRMKTVRVGMSGSFSPVNIPTRYQMFSVSARLLIAYSRTCPFKHVQNVHIYLASPYLRWESSTACTGRLDTSIHNTPKTFCIHLAFRCWRYSNWCFIPLCTLSSNCYCIPCCTLSLRFLRKPRLQGELSRTESCRDMNCDLDQCSGCRRQQKVMPNLFSSGENCW